MRHHGLWDYHSRCSLSSRNDVQYVLKMGLKIKIFMSILFSQLNCLETGDKWWIKRGFIFTRKQDMGWWLRLMTRLLKLRWQDYEQNGIPMLQQIKGVETQPWNICWEAYDMTRNWQPRVWEGFSPSHGEITLFLKRPMKLHRKRDYADRTT